jgi:hypothetical protein
MNFVNKLYLVLLLWIPEPFPQNTQASLVLPASGKELQDLIPEGWQLLSQASGDLNQDGYQDLVFAIEDSLLAKAEPSEEILSQLPAPVSRILGIYFGGRNGKFKKVLQSDTFIISREHAEMDEPFKGFQILPDGELQIDFYRWQCRECTSWSTHVYTFRYQSREFQLIQYDENVMSRVSGEEVDYHIDFLNKTIKTTSTTINEDDEREYQEERETFELPKLKSLKSMGKPFLWEFHQLLI